MIEENNLQGSELSRKDQEQIAWTSIQENGIQDVDKANLETLKVEDYSAKEIKEDEDAYSWDMAFSEVENGEKLKQDRIKKEREDQQNTELERQKQELLAKMKQSEEEFARAAEAEKIALAKEKEKIDAEKKEMEKQLAESAEL